MLLAIAALAQSGCCCFGSFDLPEPPTGNDADALAEARRYLELHGNEVPITMATDAAPSGPGGCASALVALAMTATVAILSRGHSGDDLSVSFDPGACFTGIIVYVRYWAGGWEGTGITVTLLDGTVVAFPGGGGGSGSSGGGYDSDWGSDELF